MQSRYLGCWRRIPWRELKKHDIMQIVIGYSSDLAQKLWLIGFLLTAITWRRPSYFTFRVSAFF